MTFPTFGINLATFEGTIPKTAASFPGATSYTHCTAAAEQLCSVNMLYMVSLAFTYMHKVYALPKCSNINTSVRLNYHFYTRRQRQNVYTRMVKQPNKKENKTKNYHPATINYQYTEKNKKKNHPSQYQILEYVIYIFKNFISLQKETPLLSTILVSLRQNFTPCLEGWSVQFQLTTMPHKQTIKSNITLNAYSPDDAQKNSTTP